MYALRGFLFLVKNKTKNRKNHHKTCYELEPLETFHGYSLSRCVIRANKNIISFFKKNAKKYAEHIFVARSELKKYKLWFIFSIIPLSLKNNRKASCVAVWLCLAAVCQGLEAHCSPNENWVGRRFGVPFFSLRSVSASSSVNVKIFSKSTTPCELMMRA